MLNTLSSRTILSSASGLISTILIIYYPPSYFQAFLLAVCSECISYLYKVLFFYPFSGWNIYKNGGRIDVGMDAVEWAMKADRLGAGEILLTSMDCDGTKAGYDLELTRMIAENVSIPVIASGGAGTKEHFYDALTEGKADAALAASLFHYKELEIADLKDYLAGRGVPVRR